MPTILLVEDDLAVSRVLEQHLAGAGFQVIVAPGTVSAMTELDRHPSVDLLLLDLVMPADEPDGLAFATAARSKRPDVPVIFMTGYYGFVAKSGELPGPVLYKPLDLDLLEQAITRQLQGRQHGTAQ